MWLELVSCLDGGNTDGPAIRMKPIPESSTQEVLAGLVERVTFHNDDNGFCVLKDEGARTS